jgi:hypothetical protein
VGFNIRHGVIQCMGWRRFVSKCLAYGFWRAVYSCLNLIAIQQLTLIARQMSTQANPSKL